MSVAEDQIVQEPRVVTEIPGPRSRELHARRQAVVPPGVHSVVPVYVERAHGSVLVDVDGNQIVDVCGGIGVTTIGHTDDAVVAAAQAQMAKVTHTLFTMTPYEPYVQVAEYLAKHVPGSTAAKPYKTLLMNSGAEAVENGVKIARRYTRRPGIAVLEHAYHGRTALTSSMNHKGAPYAQGYGPRVGDIYKAPNSYPLRDGLSGPDAAKRTIAYLEKMAGAEDLACLVVEPVQGEGGFIVPADGYLPALAAWCRANGIVFIADEVQAGMARTGTVFSIEQFGVEPDIVLSAKGIAGGLPLAGITGRVEIMDASLPGGLGGTFGGN
ncbi:MAG: aminotransferase class III-fold pyridoxal phosphate-dependent enzyme, partial [Leucobacter sp.]|nr:aminotransferase class III-fold pyridoxal phosphate-dependent enzyme [Leucobacter sp.]